jgi:hypothetical protein
VRSIVEVELVVVTLHGGTRMRRVAAHCGPQYGYYDLGRLPYVVTRSKPFISTRNLC